MHTMWPGDWHSCPRGSPPWAVLLHWEPESTLPSWSCFRQAFCHHCEKTKTSLVWKHKETGSGPSLRREGHNLVGEVVRIQTNIHSSKESVQVRVWTRRVFQTECRSVADQDLREPRSLGRTWWFMLFLLVITTTCSSPAGWTALLGIRKLVTVRTDFQPWNIAHEGKILYYD